MTVVVKCVKFSPIPLLALTKYSKTTKTAVNNSFHNPNFLFKQISCMLVTPCLVVAVQPCME